MVEQSQNPAEQEIINAFESLGYPPHLVGLLTSAVIKLSSGLDSSFRPSSLISDGRLVYTLSFEPNSETRQEAVTAINFFEPSSNGWGFEVVTAGETHSLTRVDAVLARPQEESFAVDFCCDIRFGTRVLEVARNDEGVIFNGIISALGNLKVRPLPHN